MRPIHFAFIFSIMMSFVANSYALLQVEDQENSKFTAYVQQPEACLESKVYPCALYSRSQKKNTIIHLRGELSFDENAVIVLLKNSVELIKGAVLVKTKHSILLKTKLTQIRIEGTAYVEDSKEASLVTVLAGLSFAKLNNGPDLRVPSGYSQWVGKIQANGQQLTSFPAPADGKRVIKQWITLNEEPKNEFKKQVFEFRKDWLAAVNYTRNLNKKEVQRQIAMKKQSDELARKRKLAREQESRQLRALLYRKTFEQ